MDASSKESIPFVKVIPSTGAPLFSDIDGKFSVSKNVTQFTLHYSGYSDTTIVVSNQVEKEIYFRPHIQNVAEVTVVAGENPAHRIIEQAIANRRKNHPLSDHSFSYKSYSKYNFDVDEASKKRIKEKKRSDTTTSIADFIENQFIFMIESASERRFIPPNKDREDIVAYKVSGIQHPMLAALVQSMQSFHFYDNQFALLGKNYINPIAKGGTNRYFFLLQDTTVTGIDTTYTISYRPRKGKDFEGLEGLLFINTNGFAIEKVTASPYADSSSQIKLKITQEYALHENNIWFPKDLSTQIDLYGLMINDPTGKGYIQGIGHTYITDLILNSPEISKRGFGNIALATDVGAENAKEKDWENYRTDSLSVKELNTYRVIDSLIKEEKLERQINGLLALTTGTVRIKYVNLLLDRLFDFNFYEGYRFGLGLETSDLVMKNITIGGYFAWATKDKDWKYGGHAKFHLNRRNGSVLSIRYHQDLIQRGSNVFQKGGFNLNSTELMSNLFRTSMDKQQLAEMTLTLRPLGNLFTHISANYQRLQTTNAYRYLPYSLDSINQFDLAETSLEVVWNIREKVSLLGDMRLAEKSIYPKLKVKLTQGWKGVFESAFTYTRAKFELKQEFPIFMAGKFSWLLSAAQTFGEVPLLLENTQVATRKDWMISVANTFETVHPTEFYHKRQAAFFTRYTFPTIKTKATWNEPQFALHHGIGYGDFSSKNEHSIPFKSMDRGIYEAGVIFNGVLVSNFMGVGLGGFYRYGYYSNTDWKKNVVPKISVSFSL